MSNSMLIVQVAPAPDVTDTVTYEVPAELGDLFATLSAAKAQREAAEKIEREAKAKILGSLPDLQEGKKVVVQVNGLPVGRVALCTRRTASVAEVLAKVPDAEKMGLINESTFPRITKA